MRCEICDWAPTGLSYNTLVYDKKRGETICSICREAISETVRGYSTDKCSEQYKREHAIKYEQEE